MKTFLSSLIVLIAFMSSYQQKIIKIPYFNKNDEFVGYKPYKVENPNQQNINFYKSSQNIPYNTPREIQMEARTCFPYGSPNKTQLGPYWVRMIDICQDKELETTYSFAETNLSKTQDPCQLKSGFYTWLITNDYQLTFGEYLNGLEWGIRHIHLAMKRIGFIGGEITIKDESIKWNLESGSFTKEIIKELGERGPQYRLRMIENMKRIWNVTKCASKFEFTEKKIKNIIPPKVYITNLCKTQDVARRILYPNSTISVCHKYECD